MSDSTSPDAPQPILGARTAMCLGAALLIGLLLLVILARVDRARLGLLEQFLETTAVGDHVYYTLPSSLPTPPAVVARVRDAALVPVDYAKFECRDTKMKPLARDPDTKLTIYESREPLAGVGNEKLYFVKTAANEYLKLRAMK